jgi:3-hydroxyisobutyrate dehydrogenase
LLGLGTMGSGMARRILAAGFPLTVFNRTASKAAPLAALGVHVAASARDAATGARVVISILADDSAARETWLGENGALAGAEPGAVLVESSTVTPQWISELAKHANGRGCELLDAPVTGSRIHAASGELCFLVGGTAEALEKARPVLAVMSRAIIHTGPGGSGALFKLLNNFLCGVQAAGLAEALALIEKSGLDTGRAFEILVNGTPGSPLVKTLWPRMLARDYTPNFQLALMAKDLRYSLNEAGLRGVQLPMASAALDVFQRAISCGLGDKDFSSVCEPARH